MPALAQQPVQQVAPILFYALALFTGLSAWAIVLSQNIVRMSVYLLFTLAGVAGLYFLMEAELLAALQLIVYAGGTLILIVFGVMLTSRNPFLQLRARPWEMVVAVAIAVVIAGVLLAAVAATTVAGPAPRRPSAAASVAAPKAAAPAKAAPAPAAVAKPAPVAPPGPPALGGHSQVEMVGRSLLGDYVAPFEVAAVLLLVVMIGAAYMARRRMT